MDNIYSESKDFFQEVAEKTSQRLEIFNTVKIAITIGILGWLIYTTFQMNVDPEKYEKFHKIHVMWFGNASPLMIIFNLWIFYFLIILAYPVLELIYNKFREKFF
jgi:hypothetical protein